MRKALLEIICCPEDKASLRLMDEVLDGDEVVTGNLVCSKCGFGYPIASGIPNLLPPEFHSS